MAFVGFYAYRTQLATWSQSKFLETHDRTVHIAFKVATIEWRQGYARATEATHRNALFAGLIGTIHAFQAISVLHHRQYGLTVIAEIQFHFYAGTLQLTDVAAGWRRTIVATTG
jgi:hypothetical protein